jgi:hypothetical protein
LPKKKAVPVPTGMEGAVSAATDGNFIKIKH